MPLRVVTILAALAAAAALAPTASAALHISSIGTFDQPVYVTAPPGDPHRVFVVEQPGRIIEVRDGVKQDPAFLDIASRVKSGGEQGLLSMAFAPDYATSGRYYVYYTAPRAGDSGGSVITVEEFSPSEHHVVFTVDHPINPNHNGGQLQFGPDGLLYAATGDGGSGNDPRNNAQNPSSNLGKLLRVDPLSSTASRPSIYALGLRNPFRFSFDRQTGDLIIGDVGQSAREEIDFSANGTAAGVNYGWRCWEGTLKNTNITPQCDPGNDVKPPVWQQRAQSGSRDGHRPLVDEVLLRMNDLLGRARRPRLERVVHELPPVPDAAQLVHEVLARRVAEEDRGEQVRRDFLGRRERGPGGGERRAESTGRIDVAPGVLVHDRRRDALDQRRVRARVVVRAGRAQVAYADALVVE